MEPFRVFMSKAKKRKKKRKRPRSEKLSSQRKRFNGEIPVARSVVSTPRINFGFLASSAFWLKNWGVLIAAGASLGLIVGVFALLPRISVSTATTLGQKFPLLDRSPFVVSNDGPFSVHSVKYHCFVRKAEFASRTTLNNQLFHDRRLDKPILRPNETDNVPCIPESDSVVKLFSADVELRVSFRPSFLFWRREEKFRFKTYRSHIGQLHWLPTDSDNNSAVAQISRLK